MYLSMLLIDLGEDPDRPHPGRAWLRNLYRVHQRLAMAFPSDSRRMNDPQFLKPYQPEDFPEQPPLAGGPAEQREKTDLCHVHTVRSQSTGFLFRVDPKPNHRAAILILSALKPDWGYAFGLRPGLVDGRGRPIGNAGHLLAALPSERPAVPPDARQGEHFRFLLQANPTRKVHALLPDSKRKESLTGNGRRVPVPTTDEAFRAWLDKHADRAGFRVVSLASVQPGYVYVNKTQKPDIGIRLRSVRYEGVLEVTDPCEFGKAWAAGIGPAKGFGFGLLSLAPA